MKFLFPLNAEGISLLSPNSHAEVKKSKATLNKPQLSASKFHNNMLWGDLFPTILLGISGHFTFEIWILQFWKIVLNPFFDSFFSSIFSVLSCASINQTNVRFPDSICNSLFFSFLLSITQFLCSTFKVGDVLNFNPLTFYLLSYF